MSALTSEPQIHSCFSPHSLFPNTLWPWSPPADLMGEGCEWQRRGWGARDARLDPGEMEPPASWLRGWALSWVGGGGRPRSPAVTPAERARRPHRPCEEEASRPPAWLSG